MGAARVWHVSEFENVALGHATYSRGHRINDATKAFLRASHGTTLLMSLGRNADVGSAAAASGFIV